MNTTNVNHTQSYVTCICGPTGAGKTAISLFIAEHIAKLRPINDLSKLKYNNCVIINADSRQLYEDFPLITAQPSSTEKQVCQHELFGFLKTEESISAGEYAKLAKDKIISCQAQNSMPILVGGTGLYLKSLLSGIADIPKVPSEISQYWRQRCLEEGSVSLHALLSSQDQKLAARLHPNDKQRILRGLEVYAATGKCLSEWQNNNNSEPAPCKVLKIGVGDELSALEPRFALRIEKMLELGAETEAQKAKEKCSDPKAAGWSGIGCAELFKYLNHEYDLAECKRLWLANTRAYAKRQLTWFKADQEINWLKTHEQEKALELSLEFIKK